MLSESQIELITQMTRILALMLLFRYSDWDLQHCGYRLD